MSYGVGDIGVVSSVLASGWGVGTIRNEGDIPAGIGIMAHEYAYII